MAHVLEHQRLLFSQPTFDELQTRLLRPKFDRYISLEDRRSLLHDFNAAADWVEIQSNSERFSRDADDDKFVHTALEGQAKWLISGDADLLVLGQVRGISVFSPAQALVVFLEHK